jgi:SHS2 domain-containing protein
MVKQRRWAARCEAANRRRDFYENQAMTRAAPIEVPQGFLVTDHTADVGLRAWGPTPAAAFVAAAEGMFAIGLGDRWERRGEPQELEVRVQAADWPSLLVEWLVELLGLFEVEGFVPEVLAVHECQPTSFAAHLTGTILASPVAMAIKAVTYHDLAVNVEPGRTEVRILFDI